MRLEQTLPAGFEMLADVDIREHSHLAVAAGYCRRLGLVGLVDRMVPTRMGLRPGLAVQGMVLDTLSGRSPLYRLEQFLAGEDAELLLGEQVDAHDFNDTNLGRSLDAIFKAGPSKIVTELGIVATRDFGLDTSVPSYDTTSTSVWGRHRDRAPNTRRSRPRSSCMERPTGRSSSTPARTTSADGKSWKRLSPNPPSRSKCG